MGEIDSPHQSYKRKKCIINQDDRNGTVFAAAVDINEPYKLAKKVGTAETFHFRPSDSERPTLQAAGAHASERSDAKFCSEYSTSFQKKACMVIHSCKPGGTEGHGPNSRQR